MCLTRLTERDAIEDADHDDTETDTFLVVVMNLQRKLPLAGALLSNNSGGPTIAKRKPRSDISASCSIYSIRHGHERFCNVKLNYPQLVPLPTHLVRIKSVVYCASVKKTLTQQVQHCKST